MKRILISCLLLAAAVSIFSCSNDNRQPKEPAKKDSTAEVKTRPSAEDTVKDGIYEKKYPDGQVAIRGEMRNGKREGTWMSYYKTGQPWSEGEYVNGLRNGKSITWYPNGQKRYEGIYTGNKETGTWKYYDEKGKLVKEIDYDKGPAMR